ncbi:conserved hypothetical protein [Uncinocarpus reesii 1704]|uniref:Mitochondrial mRNA processing protein PET127 n=1 Tax=Uncinocarpus reesii (strain UAMH 1704) TaxID=336963 RepID=C4JNP2_UNCRE|nr:uncharacterized protein UREG_03040 [Uncinocarpus reesii 1704]EEP78195.1 conserved hypothetical protein [Uncinocarpus reesii 1704]
MFSRSLQIAARPSRSYVCLFCVSRTFERSFTASSTRHDAVTDSKSDLDQKPHFPLGAVPLKLQKAQSEVPSTADPSVHESAGPQHISTTKKKRKSKKGRNGPEEPTSKATITPRKVKSKLIRKTFPSKSFAPPPPVAESTSNSEPEKHDEFRHVHAGDLEAASGILEPSEEQIEALNVESEAVPSLAYGLDRVLFNPGVYHLRDPRSRVYNFDPYLSSIMPVSEFDFEALGDYITSSRDVVLRNMARDHGKKYIGSSSSMTGVLSHFHFLLSAWRPLQMQALSQGFPDRLRSFTRLTRAPAAVFLRYKDGVYAIDADKEYDTANILMNLGKSMEKLLTMPMDEFERYRRTNANRTPLGEAAPETYHYSTCGDFLMRAQLDAHDSRLPGTGMFDLKTRAVVSIRMDIENFPKGLGYEIKSRFGDFESFEREWFDMARSAFLKYSLQVRVGRMDGIFVAFHNIQRIFGFQYLPLEDMDMVLHGQSDTVLGDTEFVHSVRLWNQVLNRAIAQFPEQSLRFHFECREGVTPFMYIFAEPVTEDEIDAIQNSNKEKIEKIQDRLLYPERYQEDAEAANVEPSPSEEAAAYPAESSEPDKPTESDSENARSKPVLGMTLRICNVVDGEIVTRPNNLKKDQRWLVDYSLTTLPENRARALLEACKRRREKQYLPTDPEGSHYSRKLWQISDRGRKWRNAQDELDEKYGIVTLNGN